MPAENKQTCPFLHYIERRRDKVIHDDHEFRDFINSQDRIVDQFMSLLGLSSTANKCDYYSDALCRGGIDAVSKLGLPSPNFVIGQSSKNMLDDAQNKLHHLRTIEYLQVNKPSEPMQSVVLDSSPAVSSSNETIVQLPDRDAISVRVKLYKKGKVNHYL